MIHFFNSWYFESIIFQCNCNVKMFAQLLRNVWLMENDYEFEKVYKILKIFNGPVTGNLTVWT